METNCSCDMDPPQAGAVDACECQAYRRFEDTIKSITSTYSQLHPTTGSICGLDYKPRGPLVSDTNHPKVATMEFLRGGVISVMATWEAYVNDLFQEAFGILLSIGENDAEKMGEKWPLFRTLYQNAFEHRQQGKHGIESKNAPVVAYELLSESWSDLVKDECKYQLRRLTNPRFSGSNGIDEIFAGIFPTRETEKERLASKSEKKKLAEENEKKKLSHKVLSIGPGVKYGFRWNAGPKYEDPINIVPVQISAQNGKVEALDDLLRLYYGLRCVFAHGKADKTLMHGVLKDFPEKPDGLHVPVKVAEKLVELFDRVKKYSRSELWLSYFIFDNMNTFIKTMAKCLCRAVAEWLEENIKIKEMWKETIASMYR